MVKDDCSRPVLIPDFDLRIDVQDRNLGRYSGCERGTDSVVDIAGTELAGDSSGTELLVLVIGNTRNSVIERCCSLAELLAENMKVEESWMVL